MVGSDICYIFGTFAEERRVPRSNILYVLLFPPRPNVWRRFVNCCRFELIEVLFIRAVAFMAGYTHCCRWLKSNTEPIWPERPRCCPLCKVPDLQVPTGQVDSSIICSSGSGQLPFKDMLGWCSVGRCECCGGGDNACFPSRLRMDVWYVAYARLRAYTGHWCSCSSQSRPRVRSIGPDFLSLDKRFFRWVWKLTWTLVSNKKSGWLVSEHGCSSLTVWMLMAYASVLSQGQSMV